MQSRFTALWSRLGVSAPGLDDSAAGLLNAYSEPSRHYHSAAHLADVLEKLDWAKTALQESGELGMMTPAEAAKMFDVIELSLWYHDAVYDAKAKDNEAKSRDWFLADAKKFGLGDDVAKDVAALIDLTAHHKEARTLPERIMTDCDLAILGAPPAAFKKYDDDIRKEYAHVPPLVYAPARQKVMAGFLNQPFIFKTEAFRKVYEAPAKRNLAPSAMPIKQRIFDWFKR